MVRIDIKLATIANEVTIDLDLRLTRPNIGQTSDLVRSFPLFNVHSEQTFF